MRIKMHDSATTKAVPRESIKFDALDRVLLFILKYEKILGVAKLYEVTVLSQWNMSIKVS